MNRFQRVTQGMDLRHDFVVAWIPILRTVTLENTEWEDGSPIKQLGPIEFARVAMAAVEQGSMNKTLYRDTEALRDRTYELYCAAASDFAYIAGKSEVLSRLAEQNAELVAWISDAQEQLSFEYHHLLRYNASIALSILEELEAQRSLKGKRGNHQRQIPTSGKSEDAEWLDIIDSSIRNEAAKSVDVWDRNNVEEIRSRIRPFVRAAMTKGMLLNDHPNKTPAELTDMHARRVLRKFDDATPKLIEKYSAPIHPDLGLRK